MTLSLGEWLWDMAFGRVVLGYDSVSLGEWFWNMTRSLGEQFWDMILFHWASGSGI
jgi:hypothetical protein